MHTSYIGSKGWRIWLPCLLLEIKWIQLLGSLLALPFISLNNFNISRSCKNHVLMHSLNSWALSTNTARVGVRLIPHQIPELDAFGEPKRTVGAKLIPVQKVMASNPSFGKKSNIS